MPRRDVEEFFWVLGGQLQRINEELRGSRPQIASGRAWEPRVDVFEEEHRFFVKVELAGVRGDAINLVYLREQHALVINGVREEEDLCGGARTGIHQLEILYGPFQREIALPDEPIDVSGIRAQYRNGFLIVMVPKLERPRLSRTIIIREG
jgi:HSP20 family protein